MGTRGQMSEAVSTGIFETLSGGFQDAYTYYCREMCLPMHRQAISFSWGSHLAAREWNLAVRYLAPVLAFAGGVYGGACKTASPAGQKVPLRQLIVAIEIILLFVVGFLPQDMNMAANIIVSFVCALQVNAFRKIKGEAPMPPTMCIGNLRSATENLYWYRHTGKKDHRDKCIRYYGVIGIFAVGAVMGSVLTAYLRERTIWVSCGLLLVSFLIMFVKEDIEGGRR